jgi:hypothetical protein
MTSPRSGDGGQHCFWVLPGGRRAATIYRLLGIDTKTDPGSRPFIGYGSSRPAACSTAALS